MKVLHFDCFSGISGDMVIGAFLDLGVETDFLGRELEKLNVPGFRIEAEKTSRHGISGTLFRVITDEIAPHHHHHDSGINHGRSHEDHEHYKENKSGHVHRNHADIKGIISASSLDEPVKKTSLAIFERVARAESRVHNIPADDINFHEVGALDSIVDIVGAAICYHKIAPDITYGSAINVGKGLVKCAHGILPVPAPATAEILNESGFSVYSREIDGESATPTGVAIISELGTYSHELPEFTPEKTGYGFGQRDFGMLNALRIFIGHRPGSDSSIVVLETNIDDMTGEALGYTLERLFAAGALDAFYTPIFMKKNRPAFKLTVLSDVSCVNAIEFCILKETSTIGLRKFPVSRTCMERQIETRHTEFGDLRVKICRFGDIHKETLEYEDVKRIAGTEGLSFDATVAMLQKLL